jgi:hypothetical protein
MRRKIGLLKRFRFGHEALQGWPVERAEATERDVAADWEDPGYGHEIEILAVTDTDKRPVELSSGEMDFVIEIITMNHSIEGRQR